MLTYKNIAKDYGNIIQEKKIQLEKHKKFPSEYRMLVLSVLSNNIQLPTISINKHSKMKAWLKKESDKISHNYRLHEEILGIFVRIYKCIITINLNTEPQAMSKKKFLLFFNCPSTLKDK